MLLLGPVISMNPDGLVLVQPLDYFWICYAAPSLEGCRHGREVVADQLQSLGDVRVERFIK